MDSQKIVGIMLLVVVGAITLALQAWKVIDIMMSLTDIWVWIAAALIGIAFNLLTRPSSKVPVSKSGPQIPAILPKTEDSVEIGGRHFDSQLYLTQDLGVLQFLFDKPVKSLRVMGISLSEFATKYRDAISGLLGKGIDVQLLLLDPKEVDADKPDLVEKYVQVTGAPDTRNLIIASLNELKSLRQKYPIKLEVRQHDFLPFHSMIVVDDSFIQVGFYLYKTGPPNRPQAIVSKLLHPKIFEKLIESYEAAWRMAKPV